MPEKNIEVFLKIDSLNLNEEITDLYVYQDNIKSEYQIYYNDEKKFPLNLEKAFWKKYGKVKNYFNIVKDIKSEFNYKENLIRITFYLGRK
jgi:hypothetical protein